MESRTSNNGSAKHPVQVVDRARSAAKRGKRSAKKLVNKVAAKAPALVDRTEHRALAAAGGLGAWMKQHPVATAGLVLGAGALIAVGIHPRLRRAALFGLSGLATVVAKRYF